MARRGGRNALEATMAALLALAIQSCANAAERLGSNCEDDDGCMKVQPLERIDSVDILMVIDSSGSVREEAELLKAELPRLLTAIVNGNDEDVSFPPASSVHVAVTTGNMGVMAQDIAGCEGLGDDGIFLRPGQVGLTCDVSYPGYLAYDGGPAAVATVDSVSCVPLVGTDGCGFEQPLEAGLKALWPSGDDSLGFLGDASGNVTPGHGDRENAGFLRDDSLLVVIVVTDEDDCSAEDPRLFTGPQFLDPNSELAMQDLNLRCFYNPDALYDPQRYIDGFGALRPGNDNVIFALIAGVPPELLGEEIEGDPDTLYAEILEDPRMQQVVDKTLPGDQAQNLAPSCIGPVADEHGPAKAYPPRRLVEVARGFGERGVLGSICDEDFGGATGRVIRAIGERLTEAANAPTEAVETE